MSHLMNTYGRLPVAFSHGEGSWLYDLSGKRYLDALAGIAVSTLGHNHPRLVRAISEQAARGHSHFQPLRHSEPGGLVGQACLGLGDG